MISFSEGGHAHTYDSLHVIRIFFPRDGLIPFPLYTHTTPVVFLVVVILFFPLLLLLLCSLVQRQPILVNHPTILTISFIPIPLLQSIVAHPPPSPFCLLLNIPFLDFVWFLFCCLFVSVPSFYTNVIWFLLLLSIAA
jgi:hypothetical protein